MILKDIIDIIESVAPLSGQESWDNSGLQIGHKEADIASVLCCTDVTEAIIDEAIAKGCNLVLSHHPLLFHGLKTIQGLTFQERVVEKALRAAICVYSSHTAMDVYLHGVSGRMAEKIGITDYRILVPTGEDIGLGVIGDLQTPVSIDRFLALVKEAFHVPAIRYTRPAGDTIRRVALGGGACGEYFEEALAQGADAFVSAEFKHHELLAADGRIMLLDIGHFESEQYTKELFRELLADAPVNVLFAEADKSPINVY